MIVTDLSNSFNPVPKMKKEKKKETTEMKKKSKKLAKLEKNRFSILTNDLEHCYICTENGLKNTQKEDLHEVFRGRNRQKSMKWGLVVPLCRKCHSKITKDKEFSETLENKARKVFIKKYSKEKFIEEFK